MASAKQKAAQNALKAFVRKHGRAPRKGESTMGASRGGARKSSTMATKSRGRVRRAASASRSFGSSFRGRSTPALKSGLDGAMTAVGRRVGAMASPTYGPGGATLAVGVWRKNEALTTLGAAEVVGRLIDSAAIPGVAAGSSATL